MSLAVIDIAIDAVLAGKVRPYGPKGLPSGIDKTEVHDAVRVTTIGLAIDEQGDPKHHGGPEKALHHYARDHYAHWQTELSAYADAAIDVLARPGAFGENLSTRGLTEADVCVGDRFRLGTALVEVSQARQPCWKLNHRFGYAGMSRAVQNSQRTGWYYRVLEEGEVRRGDRLILLARPCPQWSLQRLLRVLYVDRLDYAALAEMAELPVLAESWRKLARQRVARREVEDMEKRLSGSPAADQS
ncbi:MOSC domain-containing protein YiiM [Cupriavidus sp. YR651]|uniref:MOSC domain-containing protein n=1 Tax=Cupriavidus sp. YR651 TaxID=1855315 RepID=UPI00087E97DA|nr:MOSC domain-containing protein [Cupriavidus sp. YR651]SDC99446.1 MOSC domain-containing protein YiiM [Cupriavidus sp. YR651]